MTRIKILIVCLVCIAPMKVFSQIKNFYELAGQMNPIQTAVPFMIITPDSRAGAMGDAGVATSPDGNSMHWNPAKYAFIENDMALNVSYSPWLHNLVKDINLTYVTFHKRIDQQQVFAASLRYFSLGEIVFTDNNGIEQGQHTPNEFALDAGYSRLFSDKFSGGIAFRFIRSDITGGGYSSTLGETKAGIAFAADLSTYYQTDVDLGDKSGRLAFGANISNIGNKVGYTENQQKDFLPTNLRLGSALTVDLDDYNSLTFALDFNKLLVPTTPVYFPVGDTIFKGTPDERIVQSGEKLIKYGADPNVGVPLGMMRSFYDAPGGFKEEMNEVSYSIGIEYWYREQFAIRGGYFHENQNKGNRKYFTIGIGVRLNVFSVDFAYLVPTAGRTNPLADTMRITLAFNFEQNSSKKRR